MSTPSITPAQITAIVSAILGVVVAFGVHLSQSQQNAVLTLVTVLAPAIVLADAHIRNGRAKIVAAQVAAQGAQEPASNEVR